MSKPDKPEVVDPDSPLRGATKEDILKLEQLLSVRSQSAPEDIKPPTTILDNEKIELEKYRERERQSILKEMPKNIIEEFKLADKPLTRVKEINKLAKALQKKDVGIDTPPVEETEREKKFQWNPVTRKNEWC